MKRWTMGSTVIAAILVISLSAGAQTTLNEALFNEDGVVHDQQGSGLNTASPILAPGVSVLNGFGSSGVPLSGPPYYLSGIGNLQFTVSGAGTHDFIAYMDIDADYIHGPFNDSASFVGSPSAGMSWEIGDNGATGPGSIGYNAAHSAPGSDLLSNGNDVPAGDVDISLALGFDFTLSAGQTATIDLSLSSTSPGSGLVLIQSNDNDPNGGTPLYYSGSLSISLPPPPSPPGVPDTGATWFSLVLGLMGLAGMTRFERILCARKG